MPSVFCVTGVQETVTDPPLPVVVTRGVTGGVTGGVPPSAGMFGTAEAGHHCVVVPGRIASVHTASVDSRAEKGSHSFTEPRWTAIDCAAVN